MYSRKGHSLSIIEKCILFTVIVFIPSTSCGMETLDHSHGDGYGYGSGHSQAPYPDQSPGSSSPDNNQSSNNCSRFHEISKILQPGLTTVKVVNFLNEPMIVAYGIDHQNVAVAQWYTFNLVTNSYQINAIGKCLLKNGEIRAFEEIERKGKYFGAAAIENLNNLPIETTIPRTPPKNGHFFLDTLTTEKQSIAVIFFLETKPKPQFHIHQYLPAEDVGSAIVFKLVTKTNSNQDCALFTISNKNIFEARIYCFQPLDVSPDDEAVNEFQTIQINDFPLLTTQLIGKTTLVVIVDSDKHIHTTLKPTAKVNRNVANVWTHSPGSGNSSSFVNTQQIRMPHTVTVDSVLTAQNISFLALGSRPDNSVQVEGQISCTGLVSIYSYDKEAALFELTQNLHVNNLVQVRFLLVQETNEVLLFALSSDAVNNISIYSFKGATGWVFLCNVTVPRASFLETVSIFYQGQFRAHVIAVTPTGATVVAV